MIYECLGQYACLAGDIGFNVNNLRTGFWQLTIDGLAWGAIYALVAVGYTLVFGVLRLINFAHSEIFMLGMFGAYFCLDVVLGFAPSGNAYNLGVGLTVFYLGIALLFAMAVSGSAAVGLEFVAYRPLRRRNARPLTFLITAIGMSFVIQEFVHFVLPTILKGYGGSNAQQPIILVQPRTQFEVFGASVTNVTLVIIVAALVLARLTYLFVHHTKFGCFTPGTWIPIEDEDKVLLEEYDLYVVLPWHFRDFFMACEKFKGRKLLFPLPQPEVVFID